MKLNIKKIVDKKMETVINGYSPTQVDMFLDEVCSDYIEYNEKIMNLNSEIETLNSQIILLKEEIKILSKLENTINDDLLFNDVKLETKK